MADPTYPGSRWSREFLSPVPPPSTRHGGRFLRSRFLVVLALVVLAAGAFAFTRLGTYLYAEDPLARADVIVILAGTTAERPLEAADLYREGHAPLVMLTHGLVEPAVRMLRERGIALPTEADMNRQVLERSGVPADAILLLPQLHDNTAQEGETLRQMAAERGWRRVIVVSSKYHLRRAGFALRRELGANGVEVVMRGSRYDPSNPDRWWESRHDWRWMLSELPKFAAYVVGLGA
jgi:uncharacterized SAM-binding protein YcdF (DUF218 family)